MRTKRVYVAQDLILAVMSTGATVDRCRCLSGVPSDAVVVGAGMDGTGGVMLTFAHHSFPEVEAGDVPGALAMSYRREA